MTHKIHEDQKLTLGVQNTCTRYLRNVTRETLVFLRIKPIREIF